MLANVNTNTPCRPSYLINLLSVQNICLVLLHMRFSFVKAFDRFVDYFISQRSSVNRPPAQQRYVAV